MGKVEKDAEKLIKRRKVQDGILIALYASAGLALVLTAPGATRLLKHIDPDMKKKRDPSQRMSQAITRLIKRGYIIRTKTDNGKSRLSLTNEGVVRSEQIALFEGVEVSKQKKWDNRWRIVIFDVRENRRGVRDQLRIMLQRVGFIRVQGSVWAFPYECEELLVFLKTNLKLGKSVLYFVAEGVENDKELRKVFGLPSA